ncbi:aromatase/cyclase [Actinomadura litoris]|uniref:aromatase/cyclase n=1 Tax=Actinomadura litoris TaxID=2678616 RepID=UPI001FA714B5|nr:aromatase/cyclase [Actinomadura litoris]
MTAPSGLHEVEHTVTVRAPAAEVYRLLADVGNWPRLFPPTVHVERLGEMDGGERIQIWATANGEAKGWTSRRLLDPEARRIEFAQEVTVPPVAAMGGTWIVDAVSDEESLVRLLHHYRAIDDDPDGLAWIDSAVDRNSDAELAALKANAELGGTEPDRLLSFQDSLRVEGSAKDVYDFLNEAGLWAERLPHVARVGLTEERPGLQILEMDTRTADGSTHTTKSVRVCFPHERIVYKQITLPALMDLHTGYWLLEEDGQDGVLVTSQHTVVLNTENITKVLGADAGVPESARFVRNALSRNSTATLGHAKEYAESRR